MSMKKKLSLFLAGLLTLALFSACGGLASSSAAGGAASGGAAESTAPASAEGATLRFLDTSPSPARQEFFESSFAKLKDDLGITVTYESTPLEDAANKILVMASSNSLPDLLTTQDNWLGQFTASGWIIPLSGYIGDDTSMYSETVTKIVWANQQEMYNDIYTMPDGMMAKGIYVRKDWAAEKEIELSYDWTYDEYWDVVAQLTDADAKQYGMTYRGTRGAFDPIMVYLQTFTGGRTYDDEGNILFRSDECLDAFITYTDTYKKGYAPQESINWGFVEMVDNFCGGLTGTLNNDSEVAATCLTNMEDDQWTVLPIPHSDKDGKIYNMVNAPYSYTISKDSSNPDAAWQVIEYMSQPEISIEYCKQTGMIPIRTDVGDDPLYGPDGPYAVFIEQLNDPDMVVPTGYGPFDSTDLQQGPLFEEIQKYLLDEQDAETALNNICDMLEERMKEYLAENEGAVVDTPKSMQ